MVQLVGVDGLRHVICSPIQHQRNPSDDGKHGQDGTDALIRI
jgi:hypothetical protein